MVKLIAFYLPQYHVIPENNFWWGDGFTEWNNVRSAKPFFSGHDQPRIPDKTIGYYDLSSEDFLLYQHKMALNSGIFGFCYYYYNFDGHTLLEQPLQIMLKNKVIQNKFCLCWANESWTRAWYGQNKEVLIKQNYSEDNAVRIFYSLVKYFNDYRYIKIEGKPVFIVYNPDEITDTKMYSHVWRYLAKKHGFEGLYLICVESLVYNMHPELYGFDAAIEFAPDWTVSCLEKKLDTGFRIYDYKQTVINMMLKPEPGYVRFRGAFPGWDNTPRYKNSGICFDNFSLGTFKYFVENRISETKKNFPPDYQYVFVNAWNEWGEGCYLEPDVRYGFSKLNIIKDLIR
ncbi:Glycosyltransferase WbsX [Desulfonatronum zhilinae]|nr:Glycosyltransferase WbsX [Desulfonatronum zhilinae]